MEYFILYYQLSLNEQKLSISEKTIEEKLEEKFTLFFIIFRELSSSLL